MRPPLPKGPVEWGHQVVIGILVQTLYFGLAYIAMKLGVSAGLQALIVSLQPILVGILAPGLVHEQVGLIQWLGLGLGILGAALVILTRSAVDATSAVGILCSFGALFGMTAGALYEKRFGVAQHPVTSNRVQYAVGFAAVLPLAWALEDMHVFWTGAMVASLLYLVITIDQQEGRLRQSLSWPSISSDSIHMTLMMPKAQASSTPRIQVKYHIQPPVFIRVLKNCA
jgi:drug/metabolite transporter (DMT)-like permease